MGIYGRSNSTLSAIPDSIYDSEWNGSHFCYSYHSLTISHFQRRIILKVKWYFRQDARNLWRAYRKNGWKLMRGIYYLLDGEWVSITNSKYLGQLLNSRLCSVLGCQKLDGIKVYRYAFNIATNFPTVRLKGKHCHHENGVDFINNGKHELAATDDRACNITVVSPSEHQKEHILKKDRGYFHYTSTEPAYKEDEEEPDLLQPMNDEPITSELQNVSSSLESLSCDQLDNIELLHTSLILHLFDFLANVLLLSLVVQSACQNVLKVRLYLLCVDLLLQFLYECKILSYP